VDEAQDRVTSAHVLPAFVEIMLAAKDLPVSVAMKKSPLVAWWRSPVLAR
jgi:hypothetical protein